MDRSPFFSIIVPAHNEEKYIEATLRSIAELDYPEGSYEAIVVENASADLTYEKALPFASSTIRVLSLPGKGVSVARNKGIEEAHADADWILFLDADTLLASSFLRELEAYLQSDRAQSYVVGTTSIRPSPDRFKARCWFRFYDLIHAMTGSSCSFFMVRASALADTRFDESLTIMEDLSFTSMMRKKGKFFFMPTRSVSASIRRFDADGWFSLLALYTFVGSLPKPLQRHFGYNAVR